jgi:hypothetical protein
VTLRLPPVRAAPACTMTTDTFRIRERRRLPDPDCRDPDRHNGRRFRQPKGIKADGAIHPSGGSFCTGYGNDCLHAGGDNPDHSGTYDLAKRAMMPYIRIRAVTIQNGTSPFPIARRHRGIVRTIDGGTFDITSVDDGINSAQRRGQFRFRWRARPGRSSSPPRRTVALPSTAAIWSLFLPATAFDSNGALTIMAARWTCTCNGNGNTAIDWRRTLPLTTAAISPPTTVRRAIPASWAAAWARAAAGR